MKPHCEYDYEQQEKSLWRWLWSTTRLIVNVIVIKKKNQRHWTRGQYHTRSEAPSFCQTVWMLIVFVCTLIGRTSGVSTSEIFATRPVLNLVLQQPWWQYFFNDHFTPNCSIPYCLQYITYSHFQDDQPLIGWTRVTSVFCVKTKEKIRTIWHWINKITLQTKGVWERSHNSKGRQFL